MPGEFDLDGRVHAWGRSAGEYELFFALSDVPPSARILDCGGGPASFTQEWSARGRFVVAADPLYRFPADRIVADFEPTAQRMLEGARRARARFNWDVYGSPEGVVARRRAALDGFIADLESPASARRYVACRSPELSFASRSFDLVLCSHLLFLYSAELDVAMHVASIREMLRVAPEVRVFPLLDMDGNVSAHLEPTMHALGADATVDLVDVPFEFRAGDSKMLKVRLRR